MRNSSEDTLQRIRQEIQEESGRERELRCALEGAPPPAEAPRPQKPPEKQQERPQPRYRPLPLQRGIMRMFFQSRGKVSTPLPSPIEPMNGWTEPTPSRGQVRKGYIPVEEKIQRELQDLRDREMELKVQRSGQLPIEESSAEDSLKPARSMVQLYDSSEESSLESPTMRPARSLADLLDLDGAAGAETPSSGSLIQRWERIIRENQPS